MDKTLIIENLSAIYNTLNEIEVKGEKNNTYMANIFSVLKALIIEVNKEEIDIAKEEIEKQ